VVRYGAQGDNIQASSILPWLKENGYHVTFYCQDGLGYEVIKHDPHIDRFIVQGRDQVPNQFLLEFFENTKKKYDKWINLCESVEGTLLASPKRANFEWPNEVRAIHMNRNYLEWTHALAGVPAPYRPKFYSTLEEKQWARTQKQRFGDRVILWSLAGSSGHKVWPHLDDIILRILPSYPDVHIVLVGDDTCKLLEQGWCKHDEEKDDFVETDSRVHLRSGKWTIRQSMAFAEVADMIIGTETGLLNAAGSMSTPKIITLSHSSPEMLTKHWNNVTVLEQSEGVGCPKKWKANGGACRQLHGGDNTDPWIDCPKHEDSGTAQCQFNIAPEMMWQAVQGVLGVAPALMKRAA
jgi:ADP-heptose:LPS heptosyltransferase